MNLIHNYIYKEIILLTAAIIGVLTFLLVAVNLFKVVQLIMYTDLPMWITAKIVWLAVPLTLTLTIPAGLLSAVLIVFGRMSSDRELLALKASGIGLAPIVVPVIYMALFLCAVDLWLIATVVPRCQKESNSMKHDIVTNNPLALFTPEIIVDKIPGWRIYFAKKEGTELDDVILWQLNDQNKVVTSLRADEADINLDLEHQQLVMTLMHERGEQYQPDGDALKVHPGLHADQAPVTVSLNSFYEKIQHKLAWMTLPEIEDVIVAMQSAPSTESATPYLTELQARISFSLAAFTFIVIGIPLAIQTQRRETSWGVVLALVIVGLYYFLGAFGRGLKGYAAAYPELIIWTPNILFQIIGFWLFYRANRK
ncbi:MAG: LptF/LptG family permease [Methylacidiphilales bacterium]|nr:LptF/LptG family permease [Candidatus Methylacidiphilales bacterium]